MAHFLTPGRILGCRVGNVFALDHFSHEAMGINCHRCREIILWLQGRETGRTARCPICEAMYTRGHHSVVDEAGRVMNEDREKSDRPAYCNELFQA